jgi:hypothetical protein
MRGQDYNVAVGCPMIGNARISIDGTESTMGKNDERENARSRRMADS